MIEKLPAPMDAPVINAATWAAMTGSADRRLTETERAALVRLLDLAKADTGQSRRVADFLLAWWNPSTCGGFDLTTLWGVDDDIAADMAAVFALIARMHAYPDTMGFEAEFKAVVRAWRPDLH